VHPVEEQFNSVRQQPEQAQQSAVTAVGAGINSSSGSWTSSTRSKSPLGSMRYRGSTAAGAVAEVDASAVAGDVAVVLLVFLLHEAST
jgi:hypothetical protein